MVQSVVKYVMHKDGVYDYSVLLNTKKAYEFMGESYEEYREWKYSNQKKWPKQCREIKRDRIKAPIDILNQHFDKYIQTQKMKMIDINYKNKLPEGFEEKLKMDYVFIDTEFGELEVTDDYYDLGQKDKEKEKDKEESSEDK